MVFDELEGVVTPRPFPLPNNEATDGHVDIRGYAGQQIRSFSDWEKYALPPHRKAQHWVNGRSAFELGWSWTRDGEIREPVELSQLFELKQVTRGTVITSGNTEHETPRPFSNRGPRCHDLALQAQCIGGSLTICIEAKADESFGGSVAEELLKAIRRSSETRFPDRLDWLTRSLLGVPAFKDEAQQVLSDVVSGLRYQLLAAIAGTLLEAEIQRATTAVFVIHEFRTNSTNAAKMDANAEALDNFLRRFFSANSGPDPALHLQVGDLVGPISLTERPVDGALALPVQIPLFIGKIRTDRLA